jgi:SNF2 family DNA or RNA helicase
MKKTRRRPSKSKYLNKLEIMEGLPPYQDPYLVQLRVLKKLWPLQLKGVLFSLKRKWTFFAMEMRTGKSLTTLASLAIRHYRGSVDKVLITCPASSVPVWESETRKWLKGTTLKIAIVSFEMARFYFKYIRKEAFDAIVIDEIHRLKNPTGMQSRRIHLAARHIPYRYGLTGTLIADSAIDLFGQFRAICEQILGDSWKRFREQYLTPSGFKGYDLIISDENRDIVLRKVAPITYQVTKQEMFPNRKVLDPMIITCQLKGTQKKLYQDIEQSMVGKSNGFIVTASRVITQMIRLQQITGGHCPADGGEFLTFECPKADALAEFLQDWPRRRKLVIFARFLHELELITQVLKGKKMSYAVFDPKKYSDIEAFQRKENPQVMVLQVQRGGVSLDLTAASTAIFFSSTFSYIDYAQAISRIEGTDQHDPILAVFLVTEGTIDQDLWSSVDLKQSEAQFVKTFLANLKIRLTKTKK